LERVIATIMVRVEKIDSRISAIILSDLRTSWLVSDKKKILIDAGFPADAPHLFSGLEKLFLTPKDIDFLALTHIHIDHAGSAGHLAKENPDLKIFVHGKGAEHLIHPTRLMDSVKRAYGEKFFAVGSMLKISFPQRVIPVTTGDHIDLGDSKLKVYDTPGHARHHVVYFDKTSESVFSGDALGSRYPGLPSFVLTPPPGYDKELTRQSIDLIHGLHPKKINFTHCGQYDLDGQSDFYEKLKAKHDSWVNHVLEILKERQNMSHSEIFDKFVAKVPDLKHYPTQFFSFNLSLKGILKYLERLGQI